MKTRLFWEKPGGMVLKRIAENLAKAHMDAIGGLGFVDILRDNWEIDLEDSENTE